MATASAFRCVPSWPAAQMQPGRPVCSVRRAEADRGVLDCRRIRDTAGGSDRSCGSATRQRSIRRLAPRPPHATVHRRTRQLPPARQSTPANPRPTIRRGLVAAARRSRPYAGKVRRAPWPAALRLRSTRNRRRRTRVRCRLRGRLESIGRAQYRVLQPATVFSSAGTEGGKGGEGGDLTGTTRQAVRPSASARWNSKPPTIRLAFFLSIQPSFEWLICHHVPPPETPSSHRAGRGNQRPRLQSPCAGRGRGAECGMPFFHQAAERIAIGIVTNLFEQRRGRVGMPEPHQRIPAVVRPCATVSDNAVRLGARRTCPAPRLNDRQHGGHVRRHGAGAPCRPDRLCKSSSPASRSAGQDGSSVRAAADRVSGQRYFPIRETGSAC